MNPAFLQFTLVIVAAALISLVLRMIRQPDIIGFLALGALLGAAEQLIGVEITHTFELFSDLGLTLLLFLVGLELSTAEIRTLGKVVSLAAFWQILATLGFGLLIATFLLGFVPLTAFYVAFALTFSSTVIVLRFLTSKGDLQSLYGKICVGILLIQDILAIVAMIFFASFTVGAAFTPLVFLPVLLKTGALFGVVYYLSQHFFPWVTLALTKDTDLLFLLGLAWALGLAAFVASPFMGFSVEIGGFLAGMALANSSEHFQIATRMRPLRDLFILIFFVYLGTHIDLSFTGDSLWFAAALSVFILIMKPTIIFVIMSVLGYRKRTSFLTALTMGQISEFSFILVTLGERLGHIDVSILSLITLVGAITMTVSTFLIHHADRLYTWLLPLLTAVERKRRDPVSLETHRLRNHAVLIGHGRKGGPIYTALRRSGVQVVIVDNDPLVLMDRHEREEYVFGDITDQAIQEETNLKNARLVISTAMDLHDDLALLSFFKWKRKKPKVVVTAKTANEARQLYAAGAHYVLLPQHVAGEYLADLIKSKKDVVRALTSLRKKQERLLAME